MTLDEILVYLKENDKVYEKMLQNCRFRLFWGFFDGKRLLIEEDRHF